MTSFFGTAASESLTASNWNSTWTHLYMGDGNDTVITPSTGYGYYFNGGGGDDYFIGDSSSDYAYGGTGNDYVSGFSGNDTLSGQDGNDTVRGGLGDDNIAGEAGVDRLEGGQGKDYISGGYGTTDYFIFAKGDSNSTNAQADTIGDWDVRYDYIDSSIAGRANGYTEGWTNATTVEAAKAIVHKYDAYKNGDHAFLYNPATDTGYLLSDLDGNYNFETAVVIRGAGAASDMNWTDII